MAVTTNNGYLSVYTQTILNNWLATDNTVPWPSPPTEWWYGLLANNTANYEVSYAGYSRLETGISALTQPSGLHARIQLDPASEAFAPFPTSVNVSGIGVWDSETDGNLLAYVVFFDSYVSGDQLDLSASGGGLVLNFSSSTAPTGKKSNSVALPILATCAWIANKTTTTNNVNGIPISEILAITDRTLRSAKIIDTVSSNGSKWRYPTGGVANYGNGTTDHAVAVESDGGIVVRNIPATNPFGAAQLSLTTSIDSSTTRWVNANYGITTSGRITSIEYGFFMQANGGSPPPEYLNGEVDDADSRNIWVKLAKWTLTGSNGSFVAPTSKMAFTFGLSTNGIGYYIPNPTYGGDLTGITVTSSTQTTLDLGFPYEHSIVDGFDSTVTYEVTSIYSDAEFQYFEASAQEIPVSVPATDANIEIVEMRRYTADVRSGDSAIAFSMKLRTQDNDIPSLSGKDIRVRYSVNGGPVKDVWANTPSDYATDGRVIFGLPSSAFENAGQVRVEIAIIGPGGSIQTLPFDDTIFIGVMDSL